MSTYPSKDIERDAAAVAAAAMIAAAANSGFTIIHKRDIGQKAVRYPQKVASRRNSAGIFFTENQ